MNIYKIIFLCVVSIVFIVYLVDRFVDRTFILHIIQWKPVLLALTALCDAIAGVLPSSTFPVIAVVLRAASDATQKAEKLYLMGNLPKDERNDYAQLLIAEVLRDAGIDVTEQIQEIIDGCIAVVCMLMPHGVDPVVPEGELAAA